MAKRPARSQRASEADQETVSGSEEGATVALDLNALTSYRSGRAISPNNVEKAQEIGPQFSREALLYTGPLHTRPNDLLESGGEPR